MARSLVVGPQRRRELFYIAQGGLVALLGGLRLATDRSPFSLSPQGLFPMLMIGAGVALIAFVLPRYMRASRGMIIDDTGVTVYRPPVGLIPWDNIVGVRADRVRGRQFLHVALRDSEGLLHRNPSAGRWLRGGEVWFDASGIDMDVSDIADEISMRRGTSA